MGSNLKETYRKHKIDRISKGQIYVSYKGGIVGICNSLAMAKQFVDRREGKKA